MSNKLKIMCASLIITLMPMGSICYAKTQSANTEIYKSIWVEPAKNEGIKNEGIKNEGIKKEEQKTISQDEEVKELSLAEVLEISKDQERHNKVKGQEICMKIKVHKVEKEDDCHCITSKEGMLKKGQFKLSKDESKKVGNVKKGDEIVLKGTVKDLTNKCVTLENSKIIKVNPKDASKCKDAKDVKDHKKDCEKKDNMKKEDPMKKSNEHKKDCEMKPEKEKEDNKCRIQSPSQIDEKVKENKATE